MHDVTPLMTAVDALAARLRSMPQSTLRRGAAARARELARELAVRAQRVEEPDRPPRELPDAGLFTVGDQVAVAGHDLAEALREGGTAQDLAEAVDRVAATARAVP